MSETLGWKINLFSSKVLVSVFMRDYRHLWENNCYLPGIPYDQTLTLLGEYYSEKGSLDDVNRSVNLRKVIRYSRIQLWKLEQLSGAYQEINKKNVIKDYQWIQNIQALTTVTLLLVHRLCRCIVLKDLDHNRNHFSQMNLFQRKIMK